MSAFRLGLRLGRWGIAGFAAVGLVSTFIQTYAFYQVAGKTPAERALFGAAVSSLASHFTVVLSPPIRPDTIGGYVEWRGFHAVAVLFAVWAFASASGMLRVDEQRGVIEAVLAAGTSRLRLVASRLAVFTTGAILASLGAVAGFAVGIWMHKEAINVTGLMEEGLLLVALAACCYAIALLVSQLSSPRTATAAAGAALLVLFLLNSLSRSFEWLDGARWISPFRYYDLNQPLPPGGVFDARSVLVLFLIAVAAGIGAEAAFFYRDLGSSLLRLRVRRPAPRYEASNEPWWRAPLVRELYDRRAGLAAWIVGVSAIGALLAGLTKSVIQPLLGLPTILPILAKVAEGDLYPSLLGYIWFNFAQLLFAAFAIAQVGRWAADDTDGRLEMVLSQPRSRAGVVVERMATAAAGAALIGGASAIAVFYTSRSQGIELDVSRLATASLLLVPFVLLIASLGALLAAWYPRAAVGLLGAVVFASYLDTEVGSLLGWPQWLQDLSPFTLFGTPLATGLDTRNLTLMLALALTGVGSSILAMQRRDLGR